MPPAAASFGSSPPPDAVQWVIAFCSFASPSGRPVEFDFDPTNDKHEYCFFSNFFARIVFYISQQLIN